MISGSGGVTVEGLGTQVLTGNNTYTGGTVVSNGTLQVETNSLPTGTAVTVSGGATLDVEGDQTVGSLSDGGIMPYFGGGSIMLDSSVLTVGYGDADGGFSGTISGSGGLIKIGSGAQNLFGSDSYTGSTEVYGGTLSIGATAALPAGTDVSMATDSGATLDLSYVCNQTIGSLSGGGSVMLGSGTLTVGDGSSTTYSGAISGPGGLVKTGDGTLTLTGANTYTGGTTIDGGTLQLVDGVIGSFPGDITDNATLALANATAQTFAGIVSGSGELIKTGNGTLTLADANTYTGGTVIDGGTLQVGTAGALSARTAVTLADDPTATLDLNDFDQTIGSLSGGGIVTLGSGALTVGDGTDTTYSGVISGSGGLTMAGSGTLTLDSSSGNTFTGPVNFTGGFIRVNSPGQLGGGTSLNFDGGGLWVTGTASDYSTRTMTFASGGATLKMDAGNTWNFDNSIGNYGSGQLTVEWSGSSGNSVLVLGAANTYTGGTTIEGGMLQLGNANAISSGDLTVNNGVLDLNGYGVSVESLSGTGGTIEDTGTTGGTILTVDQAGCTTFSGVIRDDLALVKTGDGTLVLDGVNNYSGGTTVTGGTLQGTTTSLQGTINNYATLSFDQGSNGVFHGEIIGTGTLTKENLGVVTLNGYSDMASFAGAMNINGGGLTITASDDFGSPTALDMANGGVLKLTDTIGIPSSVTEVTLNAGGGTLDLAGSLNVTVPIDGPGGLTLAGSGVLILNGNNGYAGGTTVDGGTLQLGVGSDLGDSAGGLTVNGGTLDMNGNDITVGSLSGTGGVIEDTGTIGGTTLTVDQAADTAFSGVIQDGLALIKTGVGTLTLAGANTYTGGTTITGGALQGTTASLKGIIYNDATVVFDQESSGYFDGDLIGMGGGRAGQVRY